MGELINSKLTQLWDFVDTRGVIRRIVLGVAIWMTFWVTVKMVDFAFMALTLDRLSANVPLIIGAVTAPVVALGGYVFKAYLDSRAV
jgi:hypothetical protein